VYDTEELNRCGDTFKVTRTRVSTMKSSRDEPMHRGTDQHSVRFRRGLHPRGNIRDITKNLGVFAGSGIDYHLPESMPTRADSFTGDDRLKPVPLR
jgi:hypothetical protein